MIFSTEKHSEKGKGRVVRPQCAEYVTRAVYCQELELAVPVQIPRRSETAAAPIRVPDDPLGNALAALLDGIFRDSVHMLEIVSRCTRRFCKTRRAPPALLSPRCTPERIVA